jgi:hypothetical protein
VDAARSSLSEQHPRNEAAPYDAWRER